MKIVADYWQYTAVKVTRAQLHRKLRKKRKFLESEEHAEKCQKSPKKLGQLKNFKTRKGLHFPGKQLLFFIVNNVITNAILPAVMAFLNQLNFDQCSSVVMLILSPITKWKAHT